MVSLILASLTTLTSLRTSHVLEQRAEAAVTSELNSVMTTTEVFNTAMVNEAASFARLFAAEFPGPFTVDSANMVAVAGKATPQLSNGVSVLNLTPPWSTATPRKPVPSPPFLPPTAMNSSASVHR